LRFRGERFLIPRCRRVVWLCLALGGLVLVVTPGEAGILDASWTAPTTNIDGSPLTDLWFYRVYYGPASSPCPGNAFFEVPSTTPSPPANQSVTFRLTGLSIGTRYNVSVTAVNTSMGESACSVVASAPARISFGVSPTGTVNFGNVNVGDIAERVFTVSNTAGGTVTGTVSTAAPFRVVSGSPFSLVGAGATQAVTVRFIPTTAATASANVSFAADGDTIGRLATGTGVGVGLDTTPPTVAIISPTSRSTYSASRTLRGTASDNIGVTQVTWANSRGGSGTASGTTSWTASGIALQLGTNVLTVTARDAAGNMATASLTVERMDLALTDDPLTARSTPIRAAHITELRAAIDTLRVARGLPTFAWTDPVLTPGSTAVSSMPTCPCTIWTGAATPAAASSNDISAVELGVKFRSTVDGVITGLRFYKGPANTGTHVGSLWSSTGTLLATVTFTNETASGWQQVNLPSPVAITANTTYVASYHTDVGEYAADWQYFASAGVSNPPLQALANGVDDGNGVYQYGPGGFPSQTFNGANYWVDVVFDTAVRTTAASTARAAHLTELRTALNQVYQAAGQTAPTYTDATVVARGTVIKAIHLDELRSAVRALQ
jgi:uncharacterized protein DUF4082/Big-like domain-containing protein/fibronectin type III domain protein